MKEKYAYYLKGNIFSSSILLSKHVPLVKAAEVGYIYMFIFHSVLCAHLIKKFKGNQGRGKSVRVRGVGGCEWSLVAEKLWRAYTVGAPRLGVRVLVERP